MTDENLSYDNKSSGAAAPQKRVFGDIDGIEDDFLELDEFNKIKLRYRIKVPVHKHPNFNFPGKILGQKGSTLSSIVQSCRCKRIMLLGKGTIRDKELEEQRRQSGDVQYAHLNYPMHLLVEIEARPIYAFQSMASTVEALKTLLEPIKDNQPGYDGGEREYAVSAGYGGGVGYGSGSGHTSASGYGAGPMGDAHDSYGDYGDDSGYQGGYSDSYAYDGAYAGGYGASERTSSAPSAYHSGARGGAGIQNYSSSQGYASVGRGVSARGGTYRGRGAADSYSGGRGDRGRGGARGIPSNRGFPSRGATRPHPYSRGGY